LAEILFLAHRLPWPPDKGDKIRSFNLLRHLARRHRIRLGTFVDDPADRGGEGELERLCAEVFIRPLGRARRAARAAFGLVRGLPLSIAAWADPAMRRWVHDRLAKVDLAFAFSSQTAAFLLDPPVRRPWLLDLVDCDSEKWRAYARTSRGPVRLLFAREADRLSAFERRAVAASARSFLVTRAEAELLIRRAPETAARLAVLENGVDAGRFDLEPPGPDPWGEPGVPRLVFTGVMDYPPNVDAVGWFVADVLPELRRTVGRVRLAIVGARPAARVRRLAAPPDILVTGRVPDVRPWLGRADVAVAPLRIARGVQNKVLEAMAMARPVVATPEAAEGLHAEPGRELLVAADPAGFAAAIAGLLRDPDRAAAIGAAGRAYVLRAHDWSATLAPLDAAISALLDAREPPGRG
jgi:sugar transferase (PEP-CTERM/EpsH1 system associated)